MSSLFIGIIELYKEGYMSEKYELKNFGDLKPGDKLIGSDGKHTEVTKVYDKHIPDKMYEIEMEDGEVIQVSGNHLWYCETDEDEKNKDMYLLMAEDYFCCNEIPDKLVEDTHFPMELITTMFGDEIPIRAFIEEACRSLGHSSVTPHVILVNQLRESVDEEIKNYSYNNLIDFLHQMKKSVMEHNGYFYFGKVRTTDEIAQLKWYNRYVNIPHKGEML